MSRNVNDVLPEVPWINGLFVKADREAVAAQFRGAMAEILYDGCDCDLFEVSGDEARVDLLFGPEYGMGGSFYADLDEITKRTWEISGYARVSTLRCNPSWTLVEQPMPLEGHQDIFDAWLGVPNIAVWSVDGFWSARATLNPPPTDDGPDTREGFSYHAEGTFQRWVEYLSNVHDGTSFTTVGEVQPFEDPTRYKPKPKRDRMSRTILFDILANLGIDAVSVFGRRELDDPLFYTSRIKGQSCSVFEAERQRWIEVLTNL